LISQGFYKCRVSLKFHICTFPFRHREGTVFCNYFHVINTYSIHSLAFDSESKRIEYILERNFIEKSVKRPFCCTVSILQVYFTYFCYNLLGPGSSFYRKYKINIERKQNYEIGWFHNWPSIISHALYAFHFTNYDFPLWL